MLEKAQEILDKSKDIKYGWFDKNNVIHYHLNEGFAKDFRFQTIESIEKTRIAVYWETVELNRYYLEKANIPCKTYFFV